MTITRHRGGGMVRVGISSCLLGNLVRHDGGHKLDRRLRDTLGAFVAWVPVCPEVEYGLPVPREALQQIGDPSDPRLVTALGGVDHTAGMKAWTARRLDELAGADLHGFVFKSRSPSCDLKTGIFARAFRERFPLLPVEDEEHLGDPRQRERFLERALAFSRDAAGPNDLSASTDPRITREP